MVQMPSPHSKSLLLRPDRCADAQCLKEWLIYHDHRKAIRVIRDHEGTSWPEPVNGQMCWHGLRLCHQIRSLTNVFANRSFPKYFVTLRKFLARPGANPISLNPFNTNDKRNISNLVWLRRRLRTANSFFEARSLCWRTVVERVTRIAWPL